MPESDISPRQSPRDTVLQESNTVILASSSEKSQYQLSASNESDELFGFKVNENEDFIKEIELASNTISEQDSVRSSDLKLHEDLVTFNSQQNQSPMRTQTFGQVREDLKVEDLELQNCSSNAVRGESDMKHMKLLISEPETRCSSCDSEKK